LEVERFEHRPPLPVRRSCDVPVEPQNVEGDEGGGSAPAGGVDGYGTSGGHPSGEAVEAAGGALVGDELPVEDNGTARDGFAQCMEFRDRWGDIVAVAG
jgi:hypothetical protein